MSTNLQELSSKNVQNIYRLSPMQEGMYFHAVMDGGTSAYFCQNAYRVTMPLQNDLLERSLQLLVNRHDVLRTVFSHQKTEHCIQVVLKHRLAAIHFEDISSSTAQRLNNFKEEDRQRGFDLSKDMLLRLAVFKLSEEEYELVWSHHHIILDGWCAAMLMQEFTQVYMQLANGQQPKFSAAAQFGAYIEWVQQQGKERSENFWKEYLNGFNQPTGLPAKLSLKEQNFQEHALPLSPALFNEINQLAASLNITANTIYQTAWAILLSQVTNTNDIVFGAVVSARPAEVRGIDSMMGLFINTIPVRVKVSQNISALLTSIQQNALQCTPHQHYPLHQLQSLSAVKEQLIDHVFIMENFGSAFSDDDQQTAVSFSGTFSQTNYNLNVVVLPGKSINFNFNTAVYRADYIQGIGRMLQNILEQVVRNQEITNLTSQQEKDYLLQLGNGPIQQWKGTVAGLFNQQSFLYPNRIAIIAENGEELTYGELGKKVKNLSMILNASGCAKGDAIGVHTGNTVYTIISILAIFRIGGVYVPLDANLPAQRLAHIINDAGIETILANAGKHELLAGFKGNLLQADTDYDCACMEDNSADLKPEDIAYIIYTSGTTGQPKGVPICHRGLADRIVYHNEYLKLTEADRILQFAAVAFDASLVEIFMALTVGAAVVLMSKENLELLKNKISEAGVTTAIFPPAYLKLIAPQELPSLQKIISTGEAANVSSMLAHSKYRTMVNGYGPTESCVGASFHKVDPARENEYVALPVGRPFSNTRIYVVDANKKLLPQGCAGEICIAGPGLSPGYLGREALTREKFISNPFTSDELFNRMYCTGDVGYWNEHGELEYEGRLDQQVQVRGIRIEPAEIEKLIMQIAGIQQALVLQCLIADEQRLIAYVQGEQHHEKALRDHLQDRLPAYMLPWNFVMLEEFPLTPNGKVDRNKLSLPEADEATAIVQEPVSQAEQDLHTCICAVMHQQSISMHRNFLELGGDSIKAIQLISRLHRLGWKLELKEVFKYPVLKEMALRMQGALQVGDQRPVEGEVPLGPIQQEFFDREFNYPHHFNQSVLLQYNGRLNKELLTAILSKLADHHDALRMVFVGEKQINKGPGLYPELHEFDGKELSMHAEALQQSFDLSTGPLLKAAIFRMPENDRLLLVAHHLIMDGISWRILLEDISAFYSGATELPPKTDSFKSWCAQASCGEFTEVEKIELTATVLRPGVARSGFELDTQQTNNLLSGVHHAYKTEVNDILLAAVSQACGTVFEKNKITVALESHGREEMNVSRTIGWFTSVYPVTLQSSTNLSLHIRNIKEQLRAVQKKHVVSGAQILFNYLGQLDGETGNAGFTLATEFAGNNINPNEKILYPIVLTGMVINNQFKFSCRYNQSLVQEQTAVALCNEIRSALLNSIEHCAQQQHTQITPADLIAPVVDMQQLETISKKYNNKVIDVYPLSPMQEGMLFHELRGSSGAYIYQVSYRIHGKIDATLVAQTAQQLIKRHDILRTVFHFKNTEHLLQIVLAERAVDFTYAEYDEKQLQQFLKADKDKAFDLAQGPLFRLALVKISADEHVFVWTCHHILMDGWCMGILISEFKDLYAGVTLPPPAPFRQYIHWLLQQQKEQALNYWKNYLDDYSSTIKLQHYHQEATGYEAAVYKRSLSPEQIKKLKDLSYQCSATFYDSLLALWGILLCKYNHCRDAVFGSIVSGRPPVVNGIERMMGLFINMIPVRVKYNDSTLFSSLVTSLRAAATESDKYHYCSLAQLQAHTALKSFPIDHFIELENYPVQQAIAGQSQSGWKISEVNGNEHTHYDLSFVISSDGFAFHYNSNAYQNSTITGMAEHFVCLLEQVLENRWIKIDSLSLNNAAELNQIQSWSEGAYRDYPINESFFHKLTGNGIAVKDRNTSLTYDQLNETALAVASVLKNDHSLAPEEIVGICMDRSVWLPAAILGVWMAGGAYLPLDPNLPEERIRFMAQDAGIKLYLSLSGQSHTALQGYTNINLHSTKGAPLTNVPATIHQNKLAYVIYTSGSTGKPKGVMIEHGGMLNHLFNKIESLGINEHSRISQTAAIGFDISVWQLTSALLTGAQVRVFTHEEVLQPAQMLQWAEEENITHWQVSPVYLSELLNIVESRNYVPNLTSLSYMIVTGEALKPGLVKRWFNAFPAIPLVNAYGPTEASDDVTHAVLTEACANQVPIGRPLNNLQVYVKDLTGQLCATGIPGEICISGHGIARGYINKPPFENNYNTGDWGMWQADGQLYFIGRKDTQIKINGHRIEAGEIESTISAAPGIAESVIVIDEQPSIIAYIQWQPSHTANIAELKSWLKQRLTDYMIPSVFVELEKFPVTVNGKINRAELPLPAKKETLVLHERAFTEKEQALATVWQQVLGIPAVSVTDDFFENGGDSIRAIQITSRLYSRGYKLEVNDIFEAPVIAQLAERLQPLSGHINQQRLTGEIALTPVQKHFFAQPLQHPNHYNQSIMLSFRERISTELLQQLFAKLCDHHDALRMRFEVNEQGAIVQSVAENILAPIEHFDWRLKPNFNEDLRNACNNIQSSFDLSKGPLLKLALFSLPAEDCVLIVLHHLVTDGVSWRILLEDLTTLFTQYSKSQTLQLPLKTSSFLDWSNALHAHANSRKLRSEKKYWTGLLQRKEDRFITNGSHTNKQDNTTINFNKEETTQLVKEAVAAFGTDVNELLLAAMARALKSCFGKEQFLVDMERHGRENLLPTLNLSRTVGWFTSIFPFHLNVSESDDMGEQLQAVKQSIKSIPANGIGYGLMRYLLPGSLPDHTSPEIVFNYLGQFDQEIDDAICSLSPYGSGQNVNPAERNAYAMNVAAFVTKGLLTIKIDCRPGMFSEKMINDFADAFRQQLLSLANYCIHHSITADVPADYGYAEISAEDVSMINNLFN